jgi:spore maturation protein CgeB
MLTSIDGMAQEFRRNGIQADVLHHSFERSTLEAVAPLKRDVPVSFAGGLGSLHPERVEMVETLLRRTPMEVWGAKGTVRLKDRVRSWLAVAGIPQKHKLRARTLALRYPGRVHDPVFGRDYYRVLARSKIVVNRHIDCAGDWASNMRMFEATGMGACLVTDNKKNLGDLFKPGVECVAYDGLDDCVEKIKYLLKHDAEREAIAAAGQRRTLRDHRFDQRVAAMAERIDGLIAQRKAA